MTGDQFIRFVVAVNVGVAVLAAGVAWLLGSTALGIGAASGGALGVANFYLVAWLVRRMIRPATGWKGIYGVMLAGKFFLLLVILWLAINVLGLDPVGFVLGYSAMVVALLIGGFAYATRTDAAGSGDEG